MVMAACWVSAESIGKATWYGRAHAGKLMANGKPFDPSKLTCASWFHPFGTVLRVYHGAKHVDVKVTDRGPAKRLVRDDNRIVDLSEAAFKILAPLTQGKIEVRIIVLNYEDAQAQVR